MTRARRVLGAAALGAWLAASLVMAPPVAADLGEGHVDGRNDGDSATGTAGVEVPGAPGAPGATGDGSGSGDGGPNCTRSDGTRDYYRYEGLQYTTMEEQRTEIRPEEQRPGVYLHVYCGDERIELGFFPDDAPEAAPVDPYALARSVTITPPAPVVVTSPAAGDHLVGVNAWFWVDNWAPVEAPPATVGSVSVWVTAQPSALVIDPGDGSAAFTCSGQPPAYDASLPSSAQSSDCSHTYERAGTHAATATLIYDVAFTSNVGVGGDLDTIEPSTSVAMAVNEAQAIGTD